MWEPHPYLRFSYSFRPRGESATFLFATIVKGRCNCRVKERGSGRVKGRGSGRVEGRGSGRVEGRGSGRVEERGSGRVEERGSGRVKERGSCRVKERGSCRVKERGMDGHAIVVACVLCIVANKKVALSPLGRNEYEKRR